ncbi:hypothetical protein B0F90DRAFT_729888 [Multifurca ochricompacta]|uniref:Uncharacterized protein n=1 Tax=Multifurca ochricompacta TaxID=376703 RepID=A0AAD4M9X4_9AGAM|nr:hypothetical protein B0F90DRAFT_729888 [Multifurca ochricompacta]
MSLVPSFLSYTGVDVVVATPPLSPPPWNVGASTPSRGCGPSCAAPLGCSPLQTPSCPWHQPSTCGWPFAQDPSRLPWGLSPPAPPPDPPPASGLGPPLLGWGPPARHSSRPSLLPPACMALTALCPGHPLPLGLSLSATPKLVSPLLLLVSPSVPGCVLATSPATLVAFQSPWPFGVGITW